MAQRDDASHTIAIIKVDELLSQCLSHGKFMDSRQLLDLAINIAKLLAKASAVASITSGKSLSARDRLQTRTLSSLAGWLSEVIFALESPHRLQEQRLPRLLAQLEAVCKVIVDYHACVAFEF